MRTRWVRIVAGAGSVGAAVVLLTLGLPAITGVGWSAIAAQLDAVSTSTLLWLAAVWFAGLWAYTFVLTGSLPGLRFTQAFVLNSAGSAISNVLPFGGAVGVAVTFAMAGSWGHPRRAVTVATLVSGAWNVLSRLALPALGLAMLVASGHLPDRRLTIAATATTILLVCSLALGVAVLTLDREDPWVARVAHRLAPALQSPALAWLRRTGNLLSQLRHSTVEVIRKGWLRLTLGMVAYLGMQYLLFWACLTATSTHVSVSATVAAFALSRILATSSVTPGGIGVTESGTAALLVAMGAPGAPAAAAVLMFALFTHAVEILTGGLAWLVWVAARRWRVNEQGPSPEPEPRLGRAESPTPEPRSPAH
jgi:putative heme transporter